MLSVENIFEFYESSQDALSRSVYGDLLDPSWMIPMFWEGGGNYAGIYVSEPLRGRCFIHDHEEPLNLPVFRSLGRMILTFAKVRGKEDIYHANLIGDYPVLDDSQLLPNDIRLSSRWLKEYFDVEPKNNLKALFAMQLSAASDTNTLLRLLDEDDVWVQARACELIGLRRFVGGIDKMVKVALKGNNNPTIATLVALRDWHAPEAVEGLAVLKRSLPTSYSAYWRT